MRPAGPVSETRRSLDGFPPKGEERTSAWFPVTQKSLAVAEAHHTGAGEARSNAGSIFPRWSELHTGCGMEGKE